MEATYGPLDLNRYVRACRYCRAIGGEPDFDSLGRCVANEQSGEETEERKFHRFMARMSGECWGLESLIVADL